MTDERKSPQPPPLYEAFMSLKQEIFASLRVALPATIMKVDLARGTVDVRIDLMQRSQEGKISGYPTIGDCPIINIQGGGMGMRFPVATGDKCLILFCDRAIDNWQLTGSPQPIPSPRMHDLSDGFALVGINSLAGLLDLALDNDEGGIADKTAKFAIRDSKLNMSNTTKSFLTIITLLITAIQAIVVDTNTGALTPASVAALEVIKLEFQALFYT